MAVQLCVAVDIRLVLSCCVRHRKVEKSCISTWEREWPLCLFTAPVYGVVCSLVEMSVSENSAVASCGCVKAGTSQELGGVATTTTHLTPALIINVLCQKWWLLRALQMRCAELVKRWWQMLITLSVCGWYARCLIAWPWGDFCPSIWKGGYCPPRQVKWTPMSGGGDRGDDGLWIRKQGVEVVFQYFLPHCVRCTPRSKFTLVVAVDAVIL